MNRLVAASRANVNVIRSLTLADMYRNHIQERHIPNGGDPKRIIYSARPVIDFFGWERDPLTLEKPDFRAYEVARRAMGIQGPSIRREFSMLQAAFNHNEDEGRLPHRLKIKMPQKSHPRTRVWSEEEAAQLRATPMPRRVMLFYIVAFGTGARSQAIEQLTWDRVDFERRIVDFNVPGMRITNKRRARAPMSKDFMEQLRIMYDDPDRDPNDPHVIGSGPRAPGYKATPCYADCRKVVIAAGLKELGVCRHIARKCYVSWKLRKGASLTKVAMLIADRPSTAEASYGFLQPEHLRDTADL